MIGLKKWHLLVASLQGAANVKEKMGLRFGQKGLQHIQEGLQHIH